MTAEELRLFLQRRDLIDLPYARRTITMDEKLGEEVWVGIQGLAPFFLLFGKERQSPDKPLTGIEISLCEPSSHFSNVQESHYLYEVNVWQSNNSALPGALPGLHTVDADNNDTFHMTFSENNQIHLINLHVRDNQTFICAENHMNRIAWAHAMNDILFVTEHQEQIADATDIYQLLCEREQQQRPLLAPPSNVTGLGRQLWKPR